MITATEIGKIMIIAYTMYTRVNGDNSLKEFDIFWNSLVVLYGFS